MMNIFIPDLDSDAMQAARTRQAQLLKPRHALGQLEVMSIHLAGITGQPGWVPRQPAVILFAADHGIMAHELSTVPQTITAYMMGQFMAGKAAINVLARQMKARLVVVDAGVNADLNLPDSSEVRFHSCPVAKGTADFSKTTAMSAIQAAQALQTGADIVREEIAYGLDTLILGEMGIGNTTSASAIIAAITGAPVARVTGRGTGIDEATLSRKIDVITSALARHKPASDQTLMKVGGFEIGAMAGAMLYAASQRIPILLDGLISTAAALIAHTINPVVRDYLIPCHRGKEPGHIVALEFLTLEPLLALDLHLGEGSGAILALPLIEAAMRTLNEMGTFHVG